MKLIITGNVASGKTTLAREIQHHFSPEGRNPVIRLVALDIIRRQVEADGITQPALRDREAKRRAWEMLERYENCIFESVGIGSFFAKVHEHFSAKDGFFHVHIVCSPAKCLQRHNARENPQPRPSRARSAEKSIFQIARQTPARYPHLIITSQAQHVSEFVPQIMKRIT